MRGDPPPLGPGTALSVTYCSSCVLLVTRAAVCPSGAWPVAFSGDVPARKGHFPPWLQLETHHNTPRT